MVAILDGFVDSSFYYLRYLTDSDTEFLPAGCYRPVDLYVGGAEHAGSVAYFG
jgi:leucyl-tRNA synthetase